ncbi:hypothetical protein MAHJHV54_47540 [Mycobacterium avium subsp. hominissuis]
MLDGLPAGHREHTQQYVKPYDAVVSYLDELDAAVCSGVVRKGCAPARTPS